MMRVNQKIGILSVFLVAIATGVFWLAPEARLEKGLVIVTAIPADIDLMADDSGVDNRYYTGSQIIALRTDAGNDNTEPVLLSEGFYSARAPEISYNGEKMVFSGQKEKSDTWQIFSMDLKSFKVNQISDGSENCTDPTWMPDGRIAYSKLIEDKIAGPLHRLFACDPEGEGVVRLTYSPNSSIASSIFQDGRILVLDEQKYPEKSQRKLMALRTDGTKSELFYESKGPKEVIGKGWEAGEEVYFIERELENPNNTSLVSVKKGRPLSSFKNLSEGISGAFYSVSPGQEGSLLVSYKKENDDAFGFYTFDLVKLELSEVKYNKADYHIIEPVMVSDRPVPMKLPEIVDESKEKGRLLCLNADLSVDNDGSVTDDSRSTAMVQIYDLEKMIGEVPVEEDGSFYIEIDADTPVRFQTVDEKGEVLRGPSSWIWVRPNEKRSCIGCHEDRELAPDNKVPDALYAGMMKLPEGERTEEIVINGNVQEDEE
jgi:hypothetical protein